MSSRLIEMKRVLRDDGSIYLHCDGTASHYLKGLMDSIFGRENFKNEIIWKRTNGHPLSIKKFEIVTDSILLYWKSQNGYFHSVTKPLSQKSLAAYNQHDKYGRYCHKDMTGGKGGGKESYYPWNGTLPSKGRGWAPTTRMKLPKWAQDKLPDNYEKLNQLEKCHVLDDILVKETIC